jgi:hypothetical protein
LWAGQHRRAEQFAALSRTPPKESLVGCPT